MSDIKITVCTGAVLNLHVGADAPRVTVNNSEEISDLLIGDLKTFVPLSETKDFAPYPEAENAEHEPVRPTLDIIIQGGHITSRSSDLSVTIRAWEEIRKPLMGLEKLGLVTLSRVESEVLVAKSALREAGVGSVLITSDEGRRHIDLLE